MPRNDQARSRRKPLQVLGGEPDAWFADGLRFSCSQCGNCCTGEPGHVWISIEEVQRLAAHLNRPAQEVIDEYCRKVGGKLSLRERRNARGEHDCIFLEEHKVQTRTPDGQRVTQLKRVCTIYPVRPLQCRTWPFWSENLQDEARWNRAARRCPGMNVGKTWTYKHIVALRDAPDWPKAAPDSGK